jgi:hypothetical protein
MKCIWEDIPETLDERGWRRVRCTRKGCKWHKGTDPTPHPHYRIFAKCTGVTDAGELLPPLGFPGTKLTALLSSLGAAANSSCQCKAKAEQMDRWGVNGCREYRAEIVAWLKDSYSGLSWAEIAKAGAAALASGLVLKLNPLDVCGSLVDLAIEQAAKETNERIAA